MLALIFVVTIACNSKIMSSNEIHNRNITTDSKEMESFKRSLKVRMVGEHSNLNTSFSKRNIEAEGEEFKKVNLTNPIIKLNNVFHQRDRG